MINKNLSSKKGITLVALVVTIVILIILAGVTLSMVLGNNGILKYAKDAKINYTNSAAEEKEEIANLENALASNLGENSGGGTPSGGGTLPTEAGTTPYLPSSDYTQVSGTDLTTGLVIEDKSGNQYVWVEVPKTATVYPTAGLNITAFTDDEYNNIENDLHEYTKTYRNNTSYTDTYYSDAQTGLTSTQYADTKKAMLKSVYQNGGFWVGRYEAGIDTNRTSHTTVTTAMVTKANQYPYTYVYCSEAETLAKAVAPSGYNSSLLFGVQWDLVLKYLETKKAATQAELNGGDTTGSTNWGNYYNSTFTLNRGKYAQNGSTSSAWNDYTTDLASCVVSSKKQSASSNSNGILLTTGASDATSKMNIYDIAGNVWEWTMEYTSNSSYPCARRGGVYNTNGSTYPASGRSTGTTTYSVSDIGFRVALY